MGSACPIWPLLRPAVREHAGPGPRGFQRVLQVGIGLPAAESTRATAADTHPAGQASLAPRRSQAPEAGPHLTQQRSSAEVRREEGTEGAAGQPAPSLAARALPCLALPFPARQAPPHSPGRPAHAPLQATRVRPGNPKEGGVSCGHGRGFVLRAGPAIKTWLGEDGQQRPSAPCGCSPLYCPLSYTAAPCSPAPVVWSARVFLITRSLMFHLKYLHSMMSQTAWWFYSSPNSDQSS